MQASPTSQHNTNVQAEQAVLGAVLLDNDALPRVTEILGEGDFYREAHRYIFRAMQTLKNQGDRIDLITLSARMRRDRSLEEAGGEAYLAAFVDVVPTAVGAKHHARLVKKAAKHRDLQMVADVLRKPLPSPEEPEELAVRARVVLDEIAEDTQTWKPPVPFATSIGPPFPVEALPSFLADFVTEISEARQVPPDLPSSLALGALAACVGGKVEVMINPSYREPLNLFVACVLGPGTRKSAVFEDIVAPIEDWETEQVEAMRPLIAAAREKRNVEEERLRRLRKEAGKEDDPERRRALTEEAARIAENLTEPPRFPRQIADDVTPERLAGLLAETAGRMAVMSPEGGIFAIMAGRYSSTGDSNFEVFLKGHAGDTLRVDRIGRPPDFVKRPALTLALAIQPEVLCRAATQAEFRRRGLLARFLYSIPDDRVGQRRYRASGISPATRLAYEESLRVLLDLPAPEDPSAILSLRLDDEASAEWVTFHNETESAQAPGENLRPIRDWASKLPGAVARIAGLLHMATHARLAQAWEIPVGAETMLCAVALGEYFREHASVAFGLMGADPVVEAAHEILSWIIRHGHHEFTLRDLHQHHRRVKRPEDFLPVLRLLEDRGYLRQLPAPKKQGVGRQPSPRFWVNPLWLSQNSQNSQNSCALTVSVNSVNSVTGEVK